MTRRELLQLGAVAGLSTLLGRAQAADGAAVTPAAKAAKPLRILILGGTGFIGPHQVRYALARGHKLTLFNRGRHPHDWPADVEEITGDRDTGDVKSLEGREWDVCIDNPARVPFWVRDAGRVLAGKVGHYLVVSSISAYADLRTPGMDETAPLAKYSGPDMMAETGDTLRANMSLYGPLKAACEAEAEKWFPGRATIVRPTLIVGPGDETDRFTYWPVRIARGGEVLAPPANDPAQIIDVRDLSEWMIRLAEQRAFGAFNAVGPDYELRVSAMLEGARAAIGSTATFTYTTAEFLAEQKVAAWSELTAWVPGQGETAGFHRVSAAKSIAASLTYRPLALTAVDTLAYWNSLPADRRVAPKAGLKSEKETAVLQAWHARKA